MKHKVKHKSNKTNKGAKVDDPTVLRINQTARLAAQKARSVVGTGKHSQDSDSSGKPPIFRTADPEGLGKKPNALNHLLWSSPAQAGSGSGVRTGERRQGNGSFENTSSEDRLWSSPAQAGSGSGVRTGKHSQDSDSSGEPPIFRTVDPEGLGKKPTTMSYVDDPNKGRNSAPVAKPGSLSGEAARNGATDIKPTSPVTGRHGATGYEAAKNLYAGKSQKEVEQLNNFFKMQVANDASLAQRGQQTKAKQNFDSMLKRQAAASVQAKADREDNDWARSTLMKKPSLSTKKPSKPPVATGGYSRGNSNGYDEVYKPKSVVYPPPKTYRPGVNTPRAI
jgi:hypothetical protein